jgi:probable lipoprotein NlpC
MKRYFHHPEKLLKYLAAALLFWAAGVRLFAAPLEGGYTLAPPASASREEKEAASREARFRVLASAAKYERTPYRYGGIDRNGMDCSGLVYTSFKDALSVSVPRTAASLYGWVEKISADKLLPGDLVFFKTGNTGGASHVGIYVGGNRFIHSASEGPITGVMYSGLDERYWARTYTGAGRALPEADINATGDASNRTSAGRGAQPGAAAPSNSGKAPESRRTSPAVSEGGQHQNSLGAGLMFGFALAPSWNGFLADGRIVRGIASQLRLGAETRTFDRPMIFGLEFRPEWDGALGIFRLPITLSWGFNDKFRIFAGPAFSFGDATLKTSGGDRHYSSGSAWFGAVGISAAPFAIKISRGELAPYAELAWQSYLRNNGDINLNADFAAGLRLSTGLRYTWKFR